MMITVNGKTYVGKSVSVNNGVVIIDGKQVDEDSDVKYKDLVINGNVGEVRCDGSVNANDVEGNISAGGSINCDDVEGNASAGGSIRCDDIGGNAVAGGSIRHG
jgi:hypothetical protein